MIHDIQQLVIISPLLNRFLSRTPWAWTGCVTGTPLHRNSGWSLALSGSVVPGNQDFFFEFPHDLGLVTSKSIGYQAF